MGDQQHTLELSKEMCGPLSVGVDELKEVGKEFLKSGNLDNSFKEHHTPRVDLNDIRGKFPRFAKLVGERSSDCENDAVPQH